MADNAHSPLAGSGLPWSSDLGERRRFAVIMVVMLALFLPPAFLVPMMEVPEIERSEAEKVPPGWRASWKSRNRSCHRSRSSRQRELEPEQKPEVVKRSQSGRNRKWPRLSQILWLPRNRKPRLRPYPTRSPNRPPSRPGESIPVRPACHERQTGFTEVARTDTSQGVCGQYTDGRRRTKQNNHGLGAGSDWQWWCCRRHRPGDKRRCGRT